MPMLPIGLSCGGCLACGDCTIAGDDFDRADNSDMNDGAPFTWGGDTTDALIASNELVLYSGTIQRLRCPTAHPDGSSSGIASAVFRADTDDECEVWLGSDEDNCIVAQVVIGSSKTLKIIQRSGGSDTDLESVACSTSAFGSTGLTLYYDENTSTVRAVAVATAVCAFMVDPIGDKSGIAIGANAGLVYVDDFVFSRLGDGENDCPELEGCPYDPCLNYPIDSAWEAVLVLSGITDNVCTGCNEVMNATWVVESEVLGSTLLTWDTNVGTDLSSDVVCAPATAVPLRFIVQVQCFETTTRIRVNYQVLHSGGTWLANWYLSVPTADFSLYNTYHKSDGFTLDVPNSGGNRCNDSGVDFSVSWNPP